MAFFSFNKHRDELPKEKQIHDLPLSALVANPYQPRRQFSEESINELAQTLNKEGLLQPIVVRQNVCSRKKIAD